MISYLPNIHYHSLNCSQCRSILGVVMKGCQKQKGGQTVSKFILHKFGSGIVSGISVF